ncbi:MAG: cytochrome c-type biogenesis protein [Gemmatimonadaceae bacterium]
MRSALWACAALLIASGVAFAEQGTQPSDSLLEARVRDVAAELRCPVCQGESIQDSPAALAQEMRAMVREQLAAGRTPDEVKAYFVDKYGEWILLRPRARGWNVLVYALPFVVLLAGAALLARATRRWTTRGETKPVHEITET